MFCLFFPFFLSPSSFPRVSVCESGKVEANNVSNMKPAMVMKMRKKTRRKKIRQREKKKMSSCFLYKSGAILLGKKHEPENFQRNEEK